MLKFFLNVSRGEQKRRFLERLDLPDKNWKFSPAHAVERQYWDAYMEAYEAAVRGTASEHAPWFVVPPDNKWFTRVVVAAAIVEALENLNLAYPKVDEASAKTSSPRAGCCWRKASRHQRALTVARSWAF